MRYLAIAVLGWYLGGTFANADTVKFATYKTWTKDDKRTTWNGKLLKIDPNSKIAYFSFLKNNDMKYFAIHVSRIVSLEIDTIVRRKDDFPKTRAPLISPLPTNPNLRMWIEVKKFFLEIEPATKAVQIFPGRNPTMAGQILSMSNDRFKLSVLDKSYQNRELHANRDDIHVWVRGK